MLPLLRLTWAQALRQPATLLAFLLALALLGLSFVFGMFAFDDNDRTRLLATSGVAVGALLALFLSVMLSTAAVHDELANRTALTLLAKPLGRLGFLAGKALGIWAAIACLLLPLAAVHVGLFWYAAQHGFGTRAHGGLSTYEAEVWLPYGRTLYAHGLTAAQALLLSCLGCVCALRLGLTGSIVMVSGLFLAGHLLGALGLHGAVLLPALGLYQVDELLQFQQFQPSPAYFALSLVYSLLYALGSLFVGLALFTRQDLT